MASRRRALPMQKNYILDTNVLLHDPGSLKSFADNAVVVPIYVIEEVDHFKKEASELGRNAREVSRILDQYRRLGSLADGVPIEGGGTLKVILHQDHPLDTLNGHPSTVDNAILKLAVSMREANSEVPVILVTKDTNLRIKADALGIRTEDYETDRVNPNELYRGAVDLFMQPDEVRAIKKGETLPAPPNECFPNEYVWVRSEGDLALSALARFSADCKELLPLRAAPKAILGVSPGTGKTLLAIAAGLHQVEEQGTYKRLLISRPIFPMGNDIGYLPGEIEQKLNPWMQPIYDNLEFLIEQQRGRKDLSLQKLLSKGTIGIEPITYIRGRSIPAQYLVVDEAQNLTPLEVKTIITRVGEGTKIVLTGDLHQIDNPYVDVASNGFNYVVQRFRPEPMAAHVELMKGERSTLAERASDLL